LKKLFADGRCKDIKDSKRDTPDPLRCSDCTKENMAAMLSSTVMFAPSYKVRFLSGGFSASSSLSASMLSSSSITWSLHIGEGNIISLDSGLTSAEVVCKVCGSVKEERK
jgi:hypothetical protein